MKILRSLQPPAITYEQGLISIDESSDYTVGDYVLFDDGKFIVGPLRVVGLEYHKLFVTAADDYAIYKRTCESDVQLELLEPITKLDYSPVTGNLFLDGFLSAAYEDEDDGIIRVNILSDSLGLKEYFIQLMDECGIEYRDSEGGFIFPDGTVIIKILEKQQDAMPPKYIIGYLCSFIIKSWTRAKFNSRYEKYSFTLFPGEKYYNQLAPKGLYYNVHASRRLLFSIFGSFEPLAHCIDSMETLSDEPLFGEMVHYEDVFLDVAPKLIIKSLALIGCNPRPIKVDHAVSYYNICLKENDVRHSVIVAFSASESNIKENADYIIFFKGRKPRIRKLGGCMSTPLNDYDLFSYAVFNYSKELRDYLQILFNKM